MQVRVIALGSTADLLKDDRAKKAAIEDEIFIPTLLQALQVMRTLYVIQGKNKFLDIE